VRSTTDLQRNRALRVPRKTPETPADNPMTNKLGATGWGRRGRGRWFGCRPQSSSRPSVTSAGTPSPGGSVVSFMGLRCPRVCLRSNPFGLTVSRAVRDLGCL